jgi:cytoskeleton protein RodZ
LPSFGEKLKLEREKRKMTLEQISSTTKISTRLLQAMEEDKFNRLPGGIFNKGFVRAYAHAVGLDEEQTVAEYLEASGDGPATRVEPGSRESGHNTARDRVNHDSPLRITDEGSGRLEIRAEVASRGLPWGIFAVVLLIVALGLSLWNYRRLERERMAVPRVASAVAPPAVTKPPDQPSAAPSDQNASQPTTPAAEPAAQNGAATAASQNATRSAVPPATTNSASPAAGASGKIPAVGAPQAATKPEPTTQSVLPAPGEFVVSIQAKDESWLSVLVDGKPVGSETIQAGTERSFRARKQVIVKSGNAGALDFRLNGTTLPVGGEWGEVKTVTIGPGGLVLNAAPTQ